MRGEPWCAVVKYIATAAWAGLLFGVIQDLNLRFGPFIKSGALPRSLVVFALFGLGATAFVLLGIWQPRLLTSAWLLRKTSPIWLWGRWPTAVLIALAPGWLFLFTKWSEVFSGTYLRILVYLSALLLMSWLLNQGSGETAWRWDNLLASAVILASVFSLQQAFQSVVSYPFSLSWSEGNRLWDYSVRFGRSLYIYPADRAIRAYIDPGRQALWGLPFLLPGVSIGFVRFWSALVFTLPYAAFGWSVFWGKPTRPGLIFLAGLWTYLFLNQGPIYSPLVLAAILVAIGWRSPTGLAMVLVALAGYYARSSRYTWMFAPAIWAVMLSVVAAEFPEPDNVPPRSLLQRLTSVLKKWERAILLGLAGLLGGYGIPYFWMVIQTWQRGVAPSPTSTLTLQGISAAAERQPLLWDRLWPNPTYAPGIVLGLLMAVSPLIVLLVVFAIRQRWRLNRWQKLALLGALSAFLVVGLVVSVKIGGGGNLHNLDMFLIGLIFAAGLAWNAGLSQWLAKPQGQPWLVNLLILIVLFSPAASGMLNARPLGLPSMDRAKEVLQVVQEAVAREKGKGEVLFIDQRQLLTFGQVKDIPLVAEYEKKYMMDEAMAANQGYFDTFYRDLARHRFALIVSEPLWVKFQGDSMHFGNENDAWVKWISIPVLCYYEPVETFEDVGVQLLIPKAKSAPQANVVCPDY